MHRYTVYGINVESDAPLSLVSGGNPGALTISLVSADAGYFARKLRNIPLVETGVDWFKLAYLPDGSIYVRWEQWFHFLIAADGSRIAHGLFADAPAESFEAYLLNQALSFALVKMGQEPLHATCVERNGVCIGFMGASGLGKSTLAACFLAAGCRLLTDDVLVVSPEAALAEPGPQRIKLLPDIAEQFLGPARHGVAMNPASEKIIVPLSPESCCSHAVRLARLYLLCDWAESENECRLGTERLSKQDAVIRLVGGTFNRRIQGRERLERQLAWITRLAGTLPVWRLIYPRQLSRITEVRDFVFAELAAS